MMIPILLAALVVTAGEPAVVNYAVKAETTSWEPIAIKEVERIVEGAARSALSKPAAMRLVNSSFGDLKKGEYSITVLGRFVEEAERFSVYLTFGPGTRTDLPSFYASDTSEPLGRQKRAVMQKRIEEAVRRAAARLAAAIAPYLEGMRLRIEPPPIDAPDSMVEWGDVAVPRVNSKDKAIRELLDVRNPDHIRAKAMTKVRGHAFDQQVARNALERCVLFDPSPSLRRSCVSALAPIARAHVPTQRVLLRAMREDVDDGVLSELTEISKGFVGLSRLETISTWLYIVASHGTPERAAGAIAQLLAKEEDVPNLDFAVASCLQQDIVEYSKRYDCARYLLRRLPTARRLAAAWKYLHDARVYGTGERLAYEAVLDAVVPRSTREEVDPRVPAMLVDLAERRETGYVRHAVIHRCGDRAPATPDTIKRILAIAHEQKHADDAIRVSVDIVSRDKSLATMTIGALRQLEKQVKWLPQPNRGNPYRDLRKALKRLERIQAKGN